MTRVKYLVIADKFYRIVCNQYLVQAASSHPVERSVHQFCNHEFFWRFLLSTLPWERDKNQNIEGSCLTNTSFHTCDLQMLEEGIQISD